MAVLYGVVTYMTPLLTSGVFSNEPSLAMPVWKTIRGTSRVTFAVVIVFRDEYRLFQSLPPYVVHSPAPCAAAGTASARSTGVSHQLDLVLMCTLLGGRVEYGAIPPGGRPRPTSCPMGLARYWQKNLEALIMTAAGPQRGVPNAKSAD